MSTIEEQPKCAICGEPLILPNVFPPHIGAQVANELEKDGIFLICKDCHEQLGEWEPESIS